MEIKRVALVLVDISGYTRFMSRQPPRAFSHLPNPTLTPLQLWSYFVMGIGGNVVATLRHRLTRKS